MKKNNKGSSNGTSQDPKFRYLGTFHINGKSRYIVPTLIAVGERDKIKTRKKYSGSAKEGDYVLYEYKKTKRGMEAIVIEILSSNSKEPDLNDIFSIISGNNLWIDFPRDVLEEARKIPQVVTQKECEGREDFRDLKDSLGRKLHVVTIDPEGAKDFDDAVVAFRLPNGNYMLIVFISDVSYYVKPGSKLDKEAQLRTTSIYFPMFKQKVIPMLPEELSNGICSLKEGEDRLVIACIMEFSQNGQILNKRLTKGVINVSHRMDYDEVQHIIDRDDKSVMKKYSDCIEEIDTMYELAQLRNRYFLKHNYIQLRTKTTEVLVDENCKVISVGEEDTSFSHKIIEVFMLSTNMSVAEIFAEKGLTCIYRVHDRPREEKMDELNTFFDSIDLPAISDNPSSINNFISGLDDEEAALFSTLILRTFSEAQYDCENIGHYGTGIAYYCHFTSPIRRYPDLWVHRQLSKLLDSKLDDSSDEDEFWKAKKLAEHCSEVERRVKKAERDACNLKVAEYMETKVGEEYYDAIIVSISSKGLVIQLPNTVRGFIDINDLFGGEKPIFLKEDRMFLCVNSRERYQVGDLIDVRVKSANKLLKKVFFETVQEVIDA